MDLERMRRKFAVGRAKSPVGFWFGIACMVFCFMGAMLCFAIALSPTFRAWFFDLAHREW
jgi:hypothetical protein